MLKPRKRITKKELKEDKLVTFYFEASSWVEKNLRYVIGGATALVVIIVAIFLYSQSQNKANQDAAVDYARAIKAYESSDYQGALTLFSNVVDNYGGTKSGKTSRFYLANCFFFTNDYDNAEKFYNKYLSRGNDKLLTPAAMAGIAACYEQRKEYEKAAKQYEKTVSKHSDYVLVSEYLLNAAACYQSAGKADQAVKVLDQIIDDYSDSQEKDQAVILKAMIESAPAM